VIGGFDAVVDLMGGQLLRSLPYIVEGRRAAAIVDLDGNFDDAIAATSAFTVCRCVPLAPRWVAAGNSSSRSAGITLPHCSQRP